MNIQYDQFCACFRSWSGFPTPYAAVFFVFNDSRLEVVVSDVDIVGIVRFQCLNFISINK
jgi:hypothetical protein